MKKREYVLEVRGEKIYFWADSFAHATEIVLSGLNDIQDVCEHAMFKNGKCTDCDWTCEHEGDIEKGICLDCGETVDCFDEDYAYDAWKDSQAEKESA